MSWKIWRSPKRRKLRKNRAVIGRAFLLCLLSVIGGVTFPLRSLYAAPLPSFADMLERVLPGVVGVYQSHHLISSAFRISGGGPQGGPLFLTCAHALEQTEETTLQDMRGRVCKVSIIGFELEEDVALLEGVGCGWEDVPILTLGDSDRIRVGDWALAAGDHLGMGMSVTHGIVSSKNAKVLQTDTMLNSGASGGPLLNSRGEVIGILQANVGQTGLPQGLALSAAITPLKLLLGLLQQQNREEG